MSKPEETPAITLEGTPILSFAKDPWEGNWFNRHHLLSRISRKNPLLYVSEPFHIRDALQSVRRRERVSTGLRRVSDTLHLYVPPRWLPHNHRSDLMNRAAALGRASQIRAALNRLGMRKPVLYIWDPQFADMIGRFDERLVVYHCYDEHVDFPGVTPEERRTIQAQEAHILARADIVFVVSSSIYERKRPHNANTFVVRNAADYELFASARSPDTAIPADALAIPKPVIGCVTRIVDQYFHVPLMREVFTRRPDWSLAVVGPVIEQQGDGPRAAGQRQELEALKRLPNVHLLGRREQRELPGYLRAFDVCAMAYPMIENVLHTESPLKMYEYLAAGKPVVSTPLPLISQLGRVISFARDAGEWVEAVERALCDDDRERIEERQAIARQNTWDSRAAFVSAKLAEALARRGR